MPVTKKKTAKKSVAKKQSKPQYLASEEFQNACDYFKGEELQANRKKINGKTFTVSELERVEFDDDVVWLMHVDELDKAFRVNATNGRSLAEDLGEDILAWAGSSVSATVQKYKTGYGVVLNAVMDDDGDQDVDDDLPFVEDEDVEVE